MRDPQLTTLDDVSEFIVDCLHATAPTEDYGYPLIRTPNIGYGRFDLDGVQRVSQATYETWTQRAVPQPGDLILAREAPAGNVAIVLDGQQLCLGQRTVHIRPDRAKVDPSFLCYFLLAPAQRGLLLAAETGATAKHINMRDIRRLPLAGLPSLMDQQRIGAFLADYDDLIDNNRRRIKLLEDSVRLLFDEWFVRLRFPGCDRVAVFNGVPAGWHRLPLEQVLFLQRGFDLPIQDREDGAVPIYGASGINGFHNVAKVSGPGIVTGRAGSLGVVHFIAGDFWPLNTSLWVKELRRVSPRFAVHLLRSMNLERYGQGATMPMLDRKVVHQVEVLLPAPVLMANFELLATDVYDQLGILQRQIHQLTNARDLLLPRLMSGELTV
jgi:type I restriction enzyme, S subunit